MNPEEAGKTPLTRRKSVVLLALSGVGVVSGAARASDNGYGPGVTDTEIKIGQTIAYSGPASSLGVSGRSAAAYYRMVNDKGGVNGRKITLISADDAYSPPKTVEQTRRLVEQEGVLGMFGSIGAGTNASVQRYLNDHKVPQLFVLGGSARLRDARTFPWTIGGDLAFANATVAYARYVLAEVPQPRISILYQNDDLGKDHLAGLRRGLGDRAESLIVKTASFEVTDPTVDSQIIELQGASANVQMTFSSPKFAAQAIRKMQLIGWKPLHILGHPAASIPATFKPAGLDASKGIITAEFLKQPGDPALDADSDMIEYLHCMKTYAADLDPNDKIAVFGYFAAAATTQVLGMCGDNLSRENVLNKATHLSQMPVPMFLPGITMTTTPEDYVAVKQMQLQQFDGKGWVKIGGIVEG
jgi:branched-chain amino acid transport system substrate-binding protein